MDALTGKDRCCSGRMEGSPYIAAVSGVKNSGKTTFLEKLIPVLCSRGYRVALIKHDGHEFRGDVPGTDTWRLKKAGAYGTAVFSGTQWMAVKEQPQTTPEELFRLFPEADIILLEGMKHSPYPKFEMVRKEAQGRMVCDPRTVLALVTNLPESDLEQYRENFPEIPLCRPEEIGKCADILEEHMKRSDERNGQAGKPRKAR